MNTRSTAKKRFYILMTIFGMLSAWFIYVHAEGLTDKIKEFFSSDEERSLVSAPKSSGPLVGKEVINLQNAFADIASSAKQSVVSITATHIEKYEVPEYQFFFGDPFEEFFQEYFGQQRNRSRPNQKQPRKYERKYVGMGSGVVIDEKGYVLTNEHVIKGADKIQVVFDGDEKPYKAKIIGKDPRTDLAVIKILDKKTFNALPMGDSDLIRIGDWSIAIGSPFGLAQTVTVGVISAERQSVRIEEREYRSFIQTDAAINQGNSGGPLLNIKGEIIGINTAIYAPTGVFSGVGFAIPINNAKDILTDLIEKGKVVRGWLGVEIRQVDEIICKQFGLENKCGALVNRIIEGSPAQKAGIERGDIIFEFDGKQVKDVRDLQDIVGRTPPNKKVDVVVYRNKEKKTLTLKTAEIPADVSGVEDEEENKEEETSEIHEWLGMTAADMDANLKKRYGIEADLTGVVITKIERGSAASEAGLIEGDLISSINLQKIDSIKDFKKITKKLNASDGVVLDLVRRGKRFYLSFAAEQ
ncbi:MAG: Do family serine endopeptidase [bacterium]